MVGAEGFEPPTPCSQSRCATRLRYAPTGANGGARTPNLLFTGQWLYHLSYAGKLAEGVGFEPTGLRQESSGFQGRHVKPLRHPSSLSPAAVIEFHSQLGLQHIQGVAPEGDPADRLHGQHPGGLVVGGLVADPLGFNLQVNTWET